MNGSSWANGPMVSSSSISFLIISPAPERESSLPRPDGVAEHADALDLELDHVAGLQPAAVAELEDAAGADRARAEDVAGEQPCVAGSVVADRLPGVVHVGDGAA